MTLHHTIVDHTISDWQSYRPIEQLILPQWQQTMITANGIKQHYLRTGGDKPPRLLLHGFMESGVSWLRVAKTLAERYDVIMPDARVPAITGFKSGWPGCSNSSA